MLPTTKKYQKRPYIPMDQKKVSEKWGTQEEKDQVTNAMKKRTSLRKRINTLETQMQKQQKHIDLIQYFLEWKQQAQQDGKIATQNNHKQKPNTQVQRDTTTQNQTNPRTPTPHNIRTTQYRKVFIGQIRIYGETERRRR